MTIQIYGNPDGHVSRIRDPVVITVNARLRAQEAVSGLARWGGSRARDLQTGLVRTYAFALAAGLAVLVLVFVVVK